MQRRDLLKAAVALAAAGFPAARLLAAGTAPGALKALGPSQRFDYAWLKGRARDMARQPYLPPQNKFPDTLNALDWDKYQAINYRADHALWAKERLPFQVKFFHLGLNFKTPVQMYEIINGQAQELAYDPAMFDFGKSGLSGAPMPKDLGFAGFRVHGHSDPVRDVTAFLGASYFRAVGGEWQYGLSARGLAIDCGMERPEEFPVFTAFWLERPAKDSTRLVVYALLDSASVTGAYRFDIQPGDTLAMEVDAALYPRRTIERIGVAPLTSMFQYGENDWRARNDWRPQIHDSDGLSLHTGNGEWIWRPLINPAQLQFNAYQDNNPRGFGLLQRDRNFDHYQDDGVFYDRRPSVWVEPKSGWGKGSVQLVEIPTKDETFDNIVAFWNPDDKPQAGQELLFGYRLYWGAKMPAHSPMAQVVSTRSGQGGVVGQQRAYFSWRFVVDFSGGGLALLGKETNVEPIITASRGSIELKSVRRLDAVHGLRAMFDLKPTDDSNAPINLRLYLSTAGKPLTETWLYQWIPPAQRTF